MNNEMSFESIFNAGMGIAPVAKVEDSVSVEAFDGSFDSAFADLARSEEELMFLETFESVESYNSASKIKMLSKINKEYGKCNRGIESYVQSLEADEVDGTSAVKENTDEAVADAPKTWKHMKWLQTALKAAAKLLVKIWNIIKDFFIKIGTKIKDFFTKKKNDRIANEAETVNEAEMKLADLIKETNKCIARIQPKVRLVEKEVESSTNEGLKMFQASNSEISHMFKKWWMDIETVMGSSIKLLSQMGKVVLKAGQTLMDVYGSKRISDKASKKVANKITIIGSSKFEDFTARYSTLVDSVIKLTKVNMDKLKKYNNDTAKHIKANAIIEEKRKTLSESTYSVYKDTSDMAKKYFNYTAPMVTRSDFTSASTSGKKMTDVITKMAKGLSDAWTGDNVPFTKRYILKNLLGVVIEGV